MIPVRNLKWALPCPPPQFALKPKRSRGRKRQGIKYELAGQRHFQELLGPAYQSGPWFRFSDAKGTRWCQPDGILVRSDDILIVEFKYQHTPDAWAQLRLLYQPVCELVFRKPACVLECVKWYDCAVVYPEPVRLVESPEGWDGREFGVHIWKP